MGHVAAAYTTTVYPGLNVSTRYKLNVYSYDADVGVGFEYAPAVTKNKDGKESREQSVKARISLIEVGVFCSAFLTFPRTSGN